MAQTENNLINQNIDKCSPVIQTLARALKGVVINDAGHHLLAFATSMKWLQSRLDAGKEHNLKPNDTDHSFPQERYEIAKQIFEMQDNGVLDEKFNIKDFSKFKSSKLVREFLYLGKIYNLEKKIEFLNQNKRIGIKKQND